MDESRTSADDRKLANFAISPKKQLRLGLIFASGGLAIFLAFFAFEYWLLTGIISSLTPLIPEDSPVHQMLADSLMWSWVACLLIALVFALVVILGTLVITHRFYGPMIALRRHTWTLLRGEYEHRTHLRKHDEFKELANDLNQLSERLQKKMTNS